MPIVPWFKLIGVSSHWTFLAGCVRIRLIVEVTCSWILFL
ncbi:hypothetical protein LINPERHAP1_LOCUS29984, partial [Linum perenne]